MDHEILSSQDNGHSITFVYLCNRPGAYFYAPDHVWGVYELDEHGEPITESYLREWPENSGRKVRSTIDKRLLDCQDYAKYPVLGFECCVCEDTPRHRESYNSFLEEQNAHSESRGEKVLRKLLKKVYGKKFPNVRPKWLKN